MKNMLLFLLFLFFAFPLFYFVYKFGDPDQIAHDFYHYYGLYDQFDVVHTKPPFNMRFIGAFFIYLIHQLGIYYNTETRFDQYAHYMQEEVWFAAVFFNFLMVAATATLITKLYSRYYTSSNNYDLLHGVLAGLVYLLGYGTMFFDLMPVTEAFSTFLFVVMLWFYHKHSYWLVPLLVVCVFQREFLLLLMVCMCLFYQNKESTKYFKRIAIIACVLLLAYFFIRSRWFYNPELHHQTNIMAMFHQMQTLGVSATLMVKQSVISLNLFLIYLFVVGYKYFGNTPVYSKGFYTLIAMLGMAAVVTLAGGLGTNFGRMFYLATPLLACLLVKEAASLSNRSGQPTGN